jgi:hypothetical protein
MFRTQEGGRRVVSMNARAVHPGVGVLRLSDDAGGAILFTPSNPVHHLVFPRSRPTSVIRPVLAMTWRCGRYLGRVGAVSLAPRAYATFVVVWVTYPNCFEMTGRGSSGKRAWLTWRRRTSLALVAMALSKHSCR